MIRALLVLLVTAATVFAQEPRIANAKTQALSASGGLAKAIEQITKSQNGAVWVAYSIPTTGKDRMMCCFGSVDSERGNGWCCSVCRLEHEGSFFSGTSTNTGNSCGPLENDHIAFIFVRFEQQV